MSIEELLEQMEAYRARRAEKDHRPKWLRQFVRQAADLFEPLEHSGRVGFDCQADENGWIVTMYLGTTEIIGGPRDGQIDHVGFRIDLAEVGRLFAEVERLEWYSVGNLNDSRFEGSARSLLSVKGTIEGDHQIHLELLGTPPRYVGPGLKIPHAT